MKQYRGVYGVFDGTRLQYVGSSTLGLAKLEYNHRNWKQLNYSWTNFRDQLVRRGHNWHFVWLKRPFECTAEEIETIEGLLIRTLDPALNIDKDPVQSSISYGRYVTENIDNEDRS